MRSISTITAFLLGASPVLVSSASIPTTLVRRDWCDTLTKFSEADAVSLQQGLQSSNQGLTYIPSGSYVNWDLGSARACVWNDYFFENTHVSAWEVGWAVGYINDMCCAGGGSEW
ncbi:hypothetical protein BJY04DRAFT_212832 [Aspergillus karnatakaensis]|uniref:uncharacterized protein n=1 Tax=Aspergillus karnatakaensis TaxID=1810916 RepID=UPI003CCE21E8